MDVFAAGTILYERCYFGCRPYQDPDPTKHFPRAFNETTGAPIPVQEHSTRQLPQGLKELIHHMLRHEPKERSSAEEALARLNQIFAI